MASESVSAFLRRASKSNPDLRKTLNTLAKDYEAVVYGGRSQNLQSLEQSVGKLAQLSRKT